MFNVINELQKHNAIVWCRQAPWIMGAVGGGCEGAW
jgi:hypothetical protein